MSPLKAAVITLAFAALHMLSVGPFSTEAVVLLYFVLLSGRNWAVWNRADGVPDNPQRPQQRWGPVPLPTGNHRDPFLSDEKYRRLKAAVFNENLSMPERLEAADQLAEAIDQMLQPHRKHAGQDGRQ